MAVTIASVLTELDHLKPSGYTAADKVKWLSHVEARILEELLSWHQGFEEVAFDGYTYDPETAPATELLVQGAYSDVYVKYLISMIDFHNNEIMRYNNSSAQFNHVWAELAAWVNRTYVPVQRARVTRFW